MSKRFLKDRLTIIALIMLGCAGYAPGQHSDHGGPQWVSEEQLGQPKFNWQVVRRLTEKDSVGRLDVIFEVVHDMLLFVRTDSLQFEATVEASVAIEQKGEGEVGRESKTISKQVTGYEVTNSRQERLAGIFTLERPDGSYKVKLLVADKESGRKEMLDRDVTFRSTVPYLFDVSDLVLMETGKFDSKSGFPEVPVAGGATADPGKDIFLLLDLHRPDPMTASTMKLSVLDRTGKEVFRDSLSIVGGEAFAAYSMPVRVSGFTFGKYQATVTILYGGSTLVRTTLFTVNAYGLPRTIRDLEQAIKQLKYVASSDEIAKLKNRFLSEQETAFMEFWNENFPCPGESVNGKMLEYYARINYSNENFSNGTPGWETDRGRILTIYGRPSEVERNLFEEDGTPYEIWYYHHLGKRFVFRDEYGFGDYRLVTPIR